MPSKIYFIQQNLQILNKFLQHIILDSEFLNYRTQLLINAPIATKFTFDFKETKPNKKKF